ncbi:MAG: hypothetical protein QF732_03675 [Nitrospinaceae bacterium]|jgi:hypothetical protein|nr:hypothetical protein [Nitrospinaceae bacterium]
MNERLEQLKAEKARLEQSLNEINVLIDAYKRAIKEKKDSEGE